jgi:hypothetical protein
MTDIRGSQAVQHEDALIRAFVLPTRVERCLYLVADPRRRRKFTGELGHFSWFDPTYSTPVKWKADPSLPLWERHLQGKRHIVELLRSKGAGRTCWVLSDRRDKDCQEVDLEKGVEDISDGSILSCIPGRLAYFEGEDESLLLERTRN